MNSSTSNPGLGFALSGCSLGLSGTDEMMPSSRASLRTLRKMITCFLGLNLTEGSDDYR